MKDTLVSLQKNNTDLVKQLAGKTALCDDLQLQNTSLKERLIKAETNKPVGGKPQDISTPPQQTASGDLLIGNSLLQNVKKNNVKDGCRVKCIRGATVSDIHDDLTKRNISVNTLSIVVGTNDCANRTSEDEILSDYRRLLELATQRAYKVVVSSIPPVMNAAARQELTDSSPLFPC